MSRNWFSLGFGPSDGWDLLTPEQQQILLDDENAEDE